MKYVAADETNDGQHMSINPLQDIPDIVINYLDHGPCMIERLTETDFILTDSREVSINVNLDQLQNSFLADMDIGNTCAMQYVSMRPDEYRALKEFES